MNSKISRVMDIVLSIVVFVLIALFVVGFLALPVTKVTSPFGSEIGGRIYSLFSGLIDVFKNLSTITEQTAPMLINSLLHSLVAVAFVLAFGIAGIVGGIILLVSAIKVCSGAEEKKFTKKLVAFGLTCVVYAACMLGVFYQSDSSYTQTIGSGVAMILAVGIIALVIAGYYHFVNTSKTRGLLNRILDLVTSTCALVGLMLLFTAPVKTESGVSYGVFTSMISNLSSATAPNATEIFSRIMMILGCVFFIVAIAFVKKVLVNGYTLNTREDRTPDFPKSSIVQSALWLGFALIGVVIIAIAGKTFGYSAGAAIIVSMVFACLSLAGAIVNKVFQGKAEEKKEDKAVEQAA